MSRVCLISHNVLPRKLCICLDKKKHLNFQRITVKSPSVLEFLPTPRILLYVLFYTFILFFFVLLGVNGVLVYHMRSPGLDAIKQRPSPAALCLNWYNEFKDQEQAPLDFLVCPCNTELLHSDHWFWFRDSRSITTPDKNTECYDSFEKGREREFSNAVVSCNPYHIDFLQMNIQTQE